MKKTYSITNIKLIEFINKIKKYSNRYYNKIVLLNSYIS